MMRRDGDDDSLGDDTHHFPKMTGEEREETEEREERE